mgnify:CR=1 FL=1
MDTREITTTILTTLLNKEILTFENTSPNSDLEAIDKANAHKIKTICDTYKQIMETVNNP